MKLTGEATLRAGVDEVYAALNDPAMLVRTIPGCQRLVQVGDDAYKATVLAGVASIKGAFDGDVRLTDRRPSESFTLHASGAGAPGTVSAIARILLARAEGGGTLLRYDADATIGGAIGGVGQRMITGVAKKTAAEFFAAVDRELAGAAIGAAAVGPGGVEVPAGGVEVPAGVAPTAAETPEQIQRRVLPAQQAAGVWTAPVPVRDLARQRVRDLMMGAVFGAVVALLGVIVGAIVAGW